MICGSWWVIVIALMGAILLGLVLSIVWYWWLLSRPDRPGEARSNVDRSRGFGSSESRRGPDG